MPDDEKKNPEVETSSEEVSETTTVVEEKSEEETKPTEVTEETVEKTPETAETSAEPVQTAPVSETPAQAATSSSAGTLVLQWLTYAFWGWLSLGLVWLMSIVLANAILGEAALGAIPYAFAATLVLLPLAFFTDRFYSKREPLTKTGGEAVLMVIHAVLFAIAGIIALIVAVFIGISTVTLDGSSSSDGQLVAMLVAGFSALLCAGAFLRTLNPFKSRKPIRIFRFSMLGLTLLLLVLAFAGPFATSFATRNDRRIEQNLSSIESSITRYAEANDKLPDSLKDLSVSNKEARQLIEDGVVEYKKESSISKKQSIYSQSVSVEHRYQLCVTYAQESRNYDDDDSAYAPNKKEYSSYVSTYNHGAGRQCYKLYTTTLNDTSNVDVLKQ